MRMDWAKPFLKGLLRTCRVVAVILRWSTIVVFSVLFAAGLVLRFPWKVLLLLAIIPAVGIFVPRKTQKWIWGALTVLAIGVYLWIFFLPAGTGSEWRTYQFESRSDPVFLASPHNAAVHYLQIINKDPQEAFSYPYSDLENQTTYAGPWQAEQFAELSRWLDDRTPVLEALIQTSQMPLCEFEAPIDFQQFEVQSWRIKLMKAWGSILIRSAHRDLAAGHLEAAMEKELAILGMARHLFTQGTLFDQAAGYYLEQAVLRVLHVFIVEFAAEESILEAIESQTAQVESNWPENWALILQREKQLTKNIAGMFYQINEQGKTRLSRDLGRGLHDAMGHPSYRFLRAKDLSRLLVLSMWLAIPASPEGVGAMIDKRFDRYAAMIAAGKDLETVDTWPIWLRGLNPRSVADWYVKRQVSFYYPLRQKDLHHEAMRRVTRLLIELKRYKQRKDTWPELLEDILGPGLPVGQLFDPIGEQSFVYEQTEDGFRLYSIGSNQVDDGGVYDGQDKDDRLYWPTPAKPEFPEEETDPATQIPLTGN